MLIDEFVVKLFCFSMALYSRITAAIMNYPSAYIYQKWSGRTCFTVVKHPYNSNFRQVITPG